MLLRSAIAQCCAFEELVKLLSVICCCQGGTASCMNGK